MSVVRKLLVRFQAYGSHPVIPAKAGIQSLPRRRPGGDRTDCRVGLDPGLRRGDAIRPAVLRFISDRL